MVDHSELPGPGEQINPNAGPGEIHSDSIPDGDPRVQDAQSLRRRHTSAAARVREFEQARDSVDNPSRRTGTDRDGYNVITPSTHATEARRDFSAGDQRETVFDPVQDDAGPHSDKG